MRGLAVRAGAVRRLVRVIGRVISRVGTVVGVIRSADRVRVDGFRRRRGEVVPARVGGVIVNSRGRRTAAGAGVAVVVVAVVFVACDERKDSVR